MGSRYNYLVCNDIEQTIDEDRPDEDVAKDTSHQRSRMSDHNGTIPVDGHESPCKWSRHNSLMDEPSIARVAEIERRQVGEVEDEEELGPAKVTSHKQHDEGEVKQIVQNEMASHSSGSVERVGIARP